MGVNGTTVGKHCLQVTCTLYLNKISVQLFIIPGEEGVHVYF